MWHKVPLLGCFCRDHFITCFKCFHRRYFQKASLLEMRFRAFLRTNRATTPYLNRIALSPELSVGREDRDEGDPLFWTKKVRWMQGHRTNFLRVPGASGAYLGRVEQTPAPKGKKVRDPSSNSGSNWEFQVPSSRFMGDLLLTHTGQYFYSR